MTRASKKSAGILTVNPSSSHNRDQLRDLLVVRLDGQTDDDLIDLESTEDLAGVLEMTEELLRMAVERAFRRRDLVDITEQEISEMPASFEFSYRSPRRAAHTPRSPDSSGFSRCAAPHQASFEGCFEPESSPPPRNRRKTRQRPCSRPTDRAPAPTRTTEGFPLIQP